MSPAPTLHDLGGSGPPLLICHATGFCGRAYSPLARVLASNFSVWALDFPGHGDAPEPADGDYRWQSMVGTVKAAAASISKGQIACVVGHSMGGAVALQAAADHPDLFGSAYLYEPIIVTPEDAGRRTSNNPMAEAARRRQPIFASKADAMWRYAGRPPLNELDSASLAAYVEHGFRELPDGRVGLKCAPENEARTFEASAGITTGTVAGASLRVLCASGGEAASPMASLVPPVISVLANAKARVHHHLGHFGPLQSPSLIGAEIVEHARS